MRRMFIALCVIACGETSPSQPSQTQPTPSGTTLAFAGEPTPSRIADANEDDELPATKFTEGAKAFAKVRQTLLEQYYAEGIGEDELYRAATAGMLEKIEPRMAKWNKLISDRELAELQADLRGEVVGIGVKIKFDPLSGYTDVLEAVPGSPSERAGLGAGDKIVTVNGKLYKGMRLRDVVADIRGKAGETVTLTVLHGAKLDTVKVTRDRIGFDQAEHAMLSEGVGWIHVPSFNDKTPGAVKAALEDLKGAKALVVDLHLELFVESVEHFVADADVESLFLLRLHALGFLAADGHPAASLTDLRRRRRAVSAARATVNPNTLELRPCEALQPDSCTVTASIDVLV